jgi:hypothetical protein
MDKKYLQWATSNDTGISSETLLCLLLDLPKPHHWGVPGDLADFGRCYRMIELFPELKERFPEIAELHPDWRPFIDCWEQMARLYRECVKWEALPKLEQQKEKRKKYFSSPNDQAWDIMKRLNDCSRYLKGLRPQGSLSGWSNKPGYLTEKYSKKEVAQ